MKHNNMIMHLDLEIIHTFCLVQTVPELFISNSLPFNIQETKFLSKFRKWQYQ